MFEPSASAGTSSRLSTCDTPDGHTDCYCIHGFMQLFLQWYKAEDVLCGEEIAYTLFTLAQFLGFLEVVRREGPRERSFLAAGNPGGSDTLATLVEGFRFVLAASPATLQSWLCVPDDLRDHPGARQRSAYQPMKGKRKAMVAGLGDGPDSVFVPLRVSRGAQRAIGSQMGATPLGSERHYTHSYSAFLAKLKAEPDFACWLQPIEADLAALLTGPSWMGEPPAPAHSPVRLNQTTNSNGRAGTAKQLPPAERWSRVLLLQQLLVDTIDLLDPDYVRVPANRRIRLAPVAYAPLPNVEQYTAALTILSGPMDASRFTAGKKQDVEHFQALQNLLHPERVIEAANQMRRATSASNGSIAARNAAGSASSSPLSTYAADEIASAVDNTSSAKDSSTDGNSPIVPPLQLPSVGATGVQLLQAITGQRRQQEQQPQLLSGSGPPDKISADFGGTPVTAEPVEAAIKNGASSGSKKA
eukprot:GHUV01025610.1.p1 GENE.GHUV01025610.1~~GHUV01025610.1.p1  ORF type:complete len:472 (+),score=95.66 GHUV01025610.1:590-2005(+)